MNARIYSPGSSHSNKKKLEPPVGLSYFSFFDCGIIESHISSRPVVSSSKCKYLMNSQPEYIKERSKQLHVKQHLVHSGGEKGLSHIT